MESPTPPTPPPVVEAPKSNTAAFGGVLLVILAALLLLCGVCSALFYAIMPLNSKSAAEALQNNVIFGSASCFGLLLGMVLVWQGLSTLAGHAPISSARVFPPVILFVLVFFVAILLGVGALIYQSYNAYTFPPWHFVAASLPPLALLAFAARRLGKASGMRALVTAFSWGALAATTLAIILEVAVAVFMVLIAAIIFASMPNSQAMLTDLQRQLQLAQRTGDFSALGGWLSNPWVIIAGITYFAVIVPPLEEAVKALVVAFIDPSRTSREDALLWGMSAGAGFAVLENIFNASIELTAWAPLILLRVGAAVIHVANGANMGRGWYAARVERRWDKLLLAYGVSVFYHAAWNGTAILMSNSAIRIAPDLGTSPMFTLLVGALLVNLIVLASLGLAWIVYSIRSVRRRVWAT